MRGDRAQHVGARDLRPRLLAERGSRPVLPFLAWRRDLELGADDQPIRYRAGRHVRRPQSHLAGCGAVEQDAIGPAIVDGNLGRGERAMQSPSATIISGAICRARSSRTSGSSTMASSARAVLRLHTASPAPSWRDFASRQACANGRVGVLTAWPFSRGGNCGSSRCMGAGSDGASRGRGPPRSHG